MSTLNPPGIIYQDNTAETFLNEKIWQFPLMGRFALITGKLAISEERVHGGRGRNEAAQQLVLKFSWGLKNPTTMPLLLWQHVSWRREKNR